MQDISNSNQRSKVAISLHQMGLIHINMQMGAKQDNMLMCERSIYLIS